MEMENDKIQKMKKEMKFLKQYAAELRLHSVLYGDTDTSLKAEDALVDYLHYTKSVLDLRQESHVQKDAVLCAMERRMQQKQRHQERDRHAYILMQAILQLNVQEKVLLLDIYIRNLNRRLILHHQGDIVESTLYRRIHRALLHLYTLIEGI